MGMQATRQSLSGIAAFHDLSAGELERLARRCAWRRYGYGELIVGHRDESRDVFFVVEGRVRAVLYSASGKEVSFRDIGAGQTFGEFAAIDGQPRSASVVALSDALLASMTDTVFREVLRDHPSVAYETLQALTRQMRQLTERVFEFSTLAVRNRVQAELLRLAQGGDRRGGAVVLSPAPTHAEIASRVSTHREAVTREFNALAKAGIIERHGRELVVCDVARLARLVQNGLEA